MYLLRFTNGRTESSSYIFQKNVEMIFKENVMYKYNVTKIWYDDIEIIESEVPLSQVEIRARIDERRLYCDEIAIEEEGDE